VRVIDEASRFVHVTIHHVLDRPFYERLVLTPLRTLPLHEQAGGHTISRHIGQSRAALTSRLMATGFAQISSFWDEVIARTCINYAIAEQLDRVLAWMSNPVPDRLVLATTLPVRTPIGLGVRQPSLGVVYLRGVRVVLKHVGPNDFYVLTAFPV
jgi:hypothetical protein